MDMKIMTALCVPLVAQIGNYINKTKEVNFHITVFITLYFLLQKALLLWCFFSIFIPFAENGMSIK